MATYKVLQDIEAEDTLVGPLTLRQCIYAAIAVMAGYLSFICITKGAPFLVVFLLPFVAFGLFFAFPWSKQQSTEIWALAKVRFYLKPRKRIWNQSGVRELVTITVPKTINKNYTKNLTPDQVKSRLKALADTIDSRGWAVKNVDMGYYTRTAAVQGGGGSDRLVDTSNMPRDVPNYDTSMTADIFDVQNNPVAQKLDMMMSQSAGAHHQQLMQQMSQPQPALPPAGGLQAAPPQPDSYWHMRTIAPAGQQPATGPVQAMPVPPAPAMPANAPIVLPGQYATAQTQPGYDISLPAPLPTATVTPLTPADYTNIRVPGVQAAPPAPVPPPPAAAQASVTAPPNPAILELANNNDLNVATIAREAQARSAGSGDEVVISLH
ncbi:MAG TPA: PrgI family protein [Candidatus Saccharimonadales bacterium]|jgi:hypothetical protein